MQYVLAKQQMKLFALPCWPTAEQRLLLCAALAGEERAISAWREWRAKVNFEACDGASYRLLPLAWHNMDRLGESDPELQRFRGVFRQNWMRTQLMLRRLPAFTQRFEAEGIPLLFLKGVPLALGYYASVGLRPMNDLDLLVPVAEAERALNLMHDMGYRHLYPEQDHDRRLLYTHSADLHRPGETPADLHWYALEESCDADAQSCYWADPQCIEAQGTRIMAPATTELLFHTLVHGSRWDSIASLRWIPDVHMLLKRGDMDWQRLQRLAREQHLEVPVYATLQYYADLLPGEIPAGVLDVMGRRRVSAAELREFRLRGRRHTYWRRLRVHRYAYLRLRRFRAGAADISFIGYLMSRWGVDSPAAIPGFVCRELWRRGSSATQGHFSRPASR